MSDIKILMLGGRRCGKSSVLASMYKQLDNNSELKKVLNIEHRRDREGNQASLTDKQNALEHFIEDRTKGNYYLVDFNADDNFSSYKFSIGKSNTTGNITFEFIDCPGESYDDNSRDDLYNRIRKEMPECDIFIIIVDTPYLMEIGEKQSDIAMFKKVNLTTQITSLFEKLVFSANTDENTSRKIIFAPVKCEKWANNLDAVSNKLKIFYSELIKKCEQKANIYYSIIPVLTAGGIVFGEFTKPKMYNLQKCAQLGKSPNIRMSDGTYSIVKPGETLIDDDEHIKLGFPFYSWFKNIGTYDPMNCDQILFHVLRFLVYKVIMIGEANILPNWMHGLPSKKVMKQMITDLEDKNLLHDAGNGILNLRKEKI